MRPETTGTLGFLLSLTVAACGGPEEGLEGDRPGECTDGVDNDASGAADCEDLGCAEDPACAAPPSPIAVVCINEFMASNAMTVRDANGATPDWVELFNPGDEEVDLYRYSLTDDLDEPDKHRLVGELLVPARGYLLLWADGQPELGPAHLGFELDMEGEEIGLFGPDGETLERLEYGRQVTDRSAARLPDGSSHWEIVEEPTPGESNGG